MTLTSSERIPLEQLFAVATGKRALTVGIPAPEGPARRFPLTPEGAAMLTAREIDVRIEQGSPDILKGFCDIYFGDFSFTLENLERPLKFI